MNSLGKAGSIGLVKQKVRRAPFWPPSVLLLVLVILHWTLPAELSAQSQPSSNNPEAASAPTDAQKAEAQARQQSSTQQTPGSINGAAVDSSGAAVVGAHIKLTRDGQPDQELLSGDDGQFSFTGIAPGPFQLTVSSQNFAAQTVGGTLHPGEVLLVPPIQLAIATNVTQLQVTLSTEEIAEVQIKEEEKQRVLGFIPNFYVSYVPDAAPLTPKQKFELAWKSSMDPVTFALNAASAGIEQAVDQYNGFGQGADGYAKRYGTSFADNFIGTFIGGAILPSILKQDPRYFYKGTGTTRSRFFYAVANAVICKGDNGRWQANYSNILGNLAAGGISNLYYPPKDQSGAALTFENALIGIGATAAANVIQEFVVRKLTPNLPNHNLSTP